ncbi:Exonuclease [Macleaya cordata]|uniref:RNA exonuclease 4 n=1 Tax=Macleaya cordata TaxID=56857 RepID=A0A200QAS4_MACCD|nr:Exonuclease [Macleaya cordata]
MRTSFHSVHEPICGVCSKHFRYFESLREHFIGLKPKAECARVFGTQGCNLCLTILDSPNSLRLHRSTCHQLSLVTPGLLNQMTNLIINDDFKIKIDNAGKAIIRSSCPHQVVALGCKMVGGGNDGLVDLCARVCLTDEDGNIIFHTYVKPQMPITNYRFRTTGIRPENIRDAMPLRQIQQKIQDLLCNGEQIRRTIRSGSSGGKAASRMILVGYDLDHSLECLGIEYPEHLIRDTAKYPPLMKTNKLPNTLKYLAQAYLGNDIQITGIQENPYEDCVATMKLYQRMRSQVHHLVEEYPMATDPQNRNSFAVSKQNELERMTPDALLKISRSDYYCWCLDNLK